MRRWVGRRWVARLGGKPRERRQRLNAAVVQAARVVDLEQRLAVVRDGAFERVEVRGDDVRLEARARQRGNELGRHGGTGG